MGVVLLGIATLNEVGLAGAVMQMVAHGLVAGALLLTPGFFTDGVGFLLLFPPTRIWLVSLVASRMVVSTSIKGQAHRRHDGNVIDGVKYHRDD